MLDRNIEGLALTFRRAFEPCYPRKRRKVDVDLINSRAETYTKSYKFTITTVISDLLSGRNRKKLELGIAR